LPDVALRPARSNGGALRCARRDQRSRLYGVHVHSLDFLVGATVRHTIGYHIVFSGYGLWLPGDDRGSWSTAWDEQIGLVEPHTLHPGDPVRLRMAQERMKHPVVRLDPTVIASVEKTLADCAGQSDWKVAAASIESTHIHLLLTYTARDIDNTIKWLKDQATRAIHRGTRHAGPVWCKGNWRTFIFDEDAWLHARTYIERHNERRGVGPRPYAFITGRAIIP
jgi:REP element-mobilizing transposase RayT